MMATFCSALQSLGLKRPPGRRLGFSFFICSRVTGELNSTRRGPTVDTNITSQKLGHRELVCSLINPSCVLNCTISYAVQLMKQCTQVRGNNMWKHTQLTVCDHMWGYTVNTALSWRLNEVCLSDKHNISVFTATQRRHLTVFTPRLFCPQL